MGRSREIASLFFIGVFVVIIAIPTAIASVPSVSALPNSTYTEQFTVLGHRLYLSVEPSLISYYGNLSDALSSDRDWAKLVTPNAVQPIADSILKITHDLSNSDEQFADAVLSMVHQIPYNITGAKYPVETLVDNNGDCGALSLLAASILKAGGLDVILIKYTGIDPGHMNVGVYLQHSPVYHSFFMSTNSFECDNKTYWTAEATNAQDWKVGDQSDILSVAQHICIPLNNSAQSSPGQVCVSMDKPPNASSITVNVSTQSISARQNRSLVIYGEIPLSNATNNISLYVNRNGSCANYFSAFTDTNGSYRFVWNFSSDGTYYITASWSGNGTVRGADSETLVAFVGPQSLLQFSSDAYNYIIARGMGNPTKPNIGINKFLSIPLQTNISLSYDFIVLNTGSGASGIPTQTFTLPAEQQQVIRIMNRQTVQVIPKPARTIVVPTEVPTGMEVLRLPDDFNRTINSNFALILQKSNSSYILDIKGLNDYDLSDLKGSQSNATVLNATQNVLQGTWYRVVNTILDDGVTTDLQAKNDTSLLNYSSTEKLDDAKQLALLIANSVDSAIVMKNIKIEQITTPQPTQSANADSKLPASFLLYLFGLMALVIAIFVAPIIYVVAKKQRYTKAKSAVV